MTKFKLSPDQNKITFLIRASLFVGMSTGISLAVLTFKSAPTYVYMGAGMISMMIWSMLMGLLLERFNQRLLHKPKQFTRFVAALLASLPVLLDLAAIIYVLAILLPSRIILRTQNEHHLFAVGGCLALLLVYLFIVLQIKMCYEIAEQYVKLSILKATD